MAEVLILVAEHASSTSFIALLSRYFLAALTERGTKLTTDRCDLRFTNLGFFLALGLDKQKLGYWSALVGDHRLLDYVRDNNIPWSGFEIEPVIDRGDTKTLKWFADNGYFKQYKHQHYCDLAAYNGHLDMLQILKASGLYEVNRISYSAASRGHLHVLEWVVKNGQTLPDVTFSAAAAGDHLNILRWAVEKGYKFHSDVMNVAALKGRLEMLKYVSSQGTYIDNNCIHNAVKSGSLEVVKWLIGIGVGWTDRAYDEAVRRGDKKMLEWVHKWLID